MKNIRIGVIVVLGMTPSIAAAGPPSVDGPAVTITGIKRVSTASNGAQANGQSYSAVFSPDGKSVAFTSGATNLIPGTVTQAGNLYLKNLATGAVKIVSANIGGIAGNHGADGGVFSSDGSKVVFAAVSTNLVAGDTNAASDVFVKTLADGKIARVSTTKLGVQANGGNNAPVISPNGLRVAFASSATNLDMPDTNNRQDIFVKSLASGAITRVSRMTNGPEANSYSYEPVFSPDNVNVGFMSAASNLVLGDTNASNDAFLRNMTTGLVTRVSTNSAGKQGNGSSGSMRFSSDGKQIVFASDATNMVAGDTNGATDIFIKTLATGVVKRVSTNSAGKQANGPSTYPVLSPDGTMVAFVSDATNLVPGDTNMSSDIFVKTLATGVVTRVSVDGQKAQVSGNSWGPVFSPDSKHLVFPSNASTLVPGDSNFLADVFVVTFQ